MKAWLVLVLVGIAVLTGALVILFYAVNVANNICALGAGYCRPA